MKIAVVQFPGSNCDQDCLRALLSVGRVQAEYLWHKETSVSGTTAVVLPGGFSYGDYLRCGAIARFSPVMRRVVEFAEAGGLVLGIRHGFQVLCGAGLVPGVLRQNRSLSFICRDVTLRVERTNTAFTSRCEPQQRL